MRSRIKETAAIALTIALPALTGCEKSPKERLQGEWDGDSILNVSSTDLQKATGWVKGTSMIFTGSKVKVVIPAESPRSGTFKVAKAEGNNLLVSFQREEGGHDEAELQLVSDRELRWKIGGGREIVMTKKVD